MKILIIDDDAAKRTLLINALTSFGVSTESIAVAISALSARKIFSIQSFDLVILDLVLPATDKSDAPSAEIGFALLQELSEAGAARRIVGATAHEDALADFEQGFREMTEQLLLVSSTKAEWKESLRALITQANTLAERMPVYDFDICFVCALRTPEYESVLELPGISWGAETLLAGQTLCKYGQLVVGEKTLRIVAAHSKSMGMVAACHLTKILIDRFRPRAIVMTGFCGGLPGEVEMGDLVIAEKTWDWQSGKWTDSGFEHAPDQKEASGQLVALAKSLENDAVEIMKSCAHLRNPGRAPNFIVGPMLSGSAVVTAEDLHEMFAAQHRKAIAVDMESYGVYYASYYAEEPKPLFLSIKMVSDLCGSTKGKEFQKYGSALSAEVALRTLTNHFVKNSN